MRRDKKNSIFSSKCTGGGETVTYEAKRFAKHRYHSTHLVVLAAFLEDKVKRRVVGGSFVIDNGCVFFFIFCRGRIVDIRQLIFVFIF